ncbi:hypothetical protein DRE_02930 [Drechslerella stenobrocha 248]|uniref:Alkaline protease 1 n=1 Tax=Drechslerella stenobrocha 248 TaxID=1043628 RepID=W7IF71_9PEZI|nr:hypothetical protein DRE_02930 [Drechslerella stenobrocha 248]
MRISPQFSLLAATLPLISIAGLSSALPVTVDTEQTPPPKKFIVVLKNQVTSSELHNHTVWATSIHARNLEKRQKNTGTSAVSESVGVEEVYEIDKFKAYAGSFDAATLSEIEASEDVDYVEEDQPVYITGVQVERTESWSLSVLSAKGANWENAARDSNSNRLYRFDESAGEGTYAYILDTGINIAHEDFEGRAELGYNAVADTDHVDTTGHGTHVAGIVAGKKWGVAKKANVISVKIMDAGKNSTTAIAIDGFNWAVRDIIEKGRENVAVINLSVSSNISKAFNTALENAYHQGIISVASAGNSQRLATEQSPASASTAIVVGAIDRNGTRWENSNYGHHVTIMAPGTEIQAASYLDNNSTLLYSGTSQAAPHVVGLICYLKRLEGLNGTDATKTRLVGVAQKGVLDESSLKRSPNLFLYNGIEK